MKKITGTLRFEYDHEIDPVEGVGEPPYISYIGYMWPQRVWFESFWSDIGYRLLTMKFCKRVRIEFAELGMDYRDQTLRKGTGKLHISISVV